MTIRDSTAAPATGARLAMPAVCLLGAGLLLAFIGACNSKSEKGPRRGPAAQTNVQGSLFDSVAETLDHLEQFEASQILKQVCDRLNQWYLQEKPRVAWQPDPLLAGLSDELRNLPAVKLQDTMQFRQTDGWFLQESIWLRDISKTAREDQFDDLAVAERLFDWTVRNVQLEKNADSQARANPHRPYETLLLGRGTALDRAWVFMLLARQQGLDTVMLALGDPASHDAQSLASRLVRGRRITPVRLPARLADSRPTRPGHRHAVASRGRRATVRRPGPGRRPCLSGRRRGSTARDRLHRGFAGQSFASHGAGRIAPGGQAQDRFDLARMQAGREAPAGAATGRCPAMALAIRDLAPAIETR